MNRTEAMAWVLSVATDLRLSQSKTLAELVGAAMHVGRVTLAAIGRQLSGGGAAKHRIKRTWRFTANDRITIHDAMSGVLRRFLKRRRKKPLVVAFDWTDIRQFHTLMIAAVMKGRAVPLLWASHPKWKLAKSQNNLEEGLLRLLRTMVPAGVPVIVLADRGFGRTELARTCQQIGFHYVIRIKPDVWIDGDGYRGLLQDYPVHKGMARRLRNVTYRADDPVTQDVVVHWKCGLPAKKDAPWFLMTDLHRPPVALTNLYAKRMTIEELFRDHKNKRNGFSLRHTKITRAARIDRLLLILALAYWLLLGLGLKARQRYRPGMWCSSNDDKQCSVFTIGRILLDALQVTAALAFAAVADAICEAAPNWG
jgi:hypothetical protein